MDSGLEAYLAPYREGVEAYGSEVVGRAADELRVRTKPENGMANVVADSLRAIGQEVFEREVDVAFTNFGGLRRDLEEGPLTVGLLTELSPFENFIVLLEMRGEQLVKVVRRLARSGGWPQSGMDIVITDDGELVSAKVNGESIDEDGIYKVATIDYLLNTDKGSYPRERLLSVTTSGTRQRDALIEYVKRLHESGAAIRNEGDGRTKVVEH